MTRRTTPRKRWTHLSASDRLRLVAAVVRGETLPVPQTLTDIARMFDVSRGTATRIVSAVLKYPRSNHDHRLDETNEQDQADHARRA